MPIDYKKYPKNWKTEIVPQVKERYDNKCAFCGLRNYTVGNRIGSLFVPTGGNEHHDKAGNGELSYKEARELVKHCNEFADDYLIVIVLTVAHLDHNIQNNDLLNLKPLCQKCHLNYDHEHHKKNARETLKKKKGIVEMQFSPHEA